MESPSFHKAEPTGTVVLAYYQFNDVEALGRSTGGGPDATAAGSAEAVLSAGPWFPATVLAVTPDTGRLGERAELMLTGANFAASPFLQCYMGESAVPCEIGRASCRERV